MPKKELIMEIFNWPIISTGRVLLMAVSFGSFLNIFSLVSGSLNKLFGLINPVTLNQRPKHSQFKYKNSYSTTENPDNGFMDNGTPHRATTTSEFIITITVTSLANLIKPLVASLWRFEATWCTSCTSKLDGMSKAATSLSIFMILEKPACLI